MALHYLYPGWNSLRGVWMTSRHIAIGSMVVCARDVVSVIFRRRQRSWLIDATRRDLISNLLMRLWDHGQFLSIWHFDKTWSRLEGRGRAIKQLVNLAFSTVYCGEVHISAISVLSDLEYNWRSVNRGRSTSLWRVRTMCTVEELREYLQGINKGEPASTMIQVL